MINIICVNYNTPEYIERLIKSWEYYEYNKYQLIIVDGSDKSRKILESKELKEKYKSVVFDYVGHNIHHGPGLHYAIKKYVADYHVLVDSDMAFAASGFVDYCLKNTKPYGIGRFETVKYGSIRLNYMHPNGCLISHDEYLKHKPLLAHGSPFYQAMVELHNKKVFNDLVAEIPFDVYSSYINKGRRGTRNISGMSAHLFGRLNRKYHLV